MAAPVCLSACGSSTRNSSGSGHPTKQLALAECMRAHGVTSFPDPITGSGGGQGFSIRATPGSSSLTVNGTTFSGPAFTTAEKTCKLFGGGTAPPPVSEKQKIQLVDFARCMRAHGVSDWADPRFPPGGGIEQGGLPNQSDFNSPQVIQAAQTCNRLTGL